MEHIRTERYSSKSSATLIHSLLTGVGFGQPLTLSASFEDLSVWHANSTDRTRLVAKFSTSTENVEMLVGS